VNTESTYDWTASQWTVPVNFAVQQLVKIGKQPVAFQVGYRYYADKPDGGPDWGLHRHVPVPEISLGRLWGHWVWSRRYGLEDGVSALISWALIVTILIYIYPLPPGGRRPRSRVSLSGCSFHKDTDLFGSEYYFRLVVALSKREYSPPPTRGIRKSPERTVAAYQRHP